MRKEPMWRIEMLRRVTRCQRWLRSCGDWQTHMETGQPFRIQVAGERIRVPARAEFTIEHERSSDEEEVEFQLKWKLDPDDDQRSEDERVV